MEHKLADSASRDEIVECYHIVLGRPPENETVVQYLLDRRLTVIQVVKAFLQSSDHKIRHKQFSLLKCDKPYLTVDMTDRSALLCFLEHYRFISQTLPNKDLQSLLQGRSLTFPIEHLPRDFFIGLKISEENIAEGEFSLYMKLRCDHIYSISFSFIPGTVLGSSDPTVLLISKMQGAVNKYAEIRDAAKLIGLSPQSFLFTMVAGIAQSSGLTQIYGVRAVNQLSYGEDKHEPMHRTYDQFFLSQTNADLVGGVYSINIPLRPKPLALIKIGHRLRARSRRRAREKISSSAAHTWGQWRAKADHGSMETTTAETFGFDAASPSVSEIQTEALPAADQAGARRQTHGCLTGSGPKIAPAPRWSTRPSFIPSWLASKPSDT